MMGEEHALPGHAIAVVGMGLRFAGADSPEKFWHNLRYGVRSIRDYSSDELLAAGVDSAALQDPSYVRSGAPLDDMDQFDAGFFGFSPKEAAIMDPQHRKFLECCWEALEDSTLPPGRFDGPIGVFAGCGMNSYFIFNLLRNPSMRDSVGMFLLRHTGNDKDFLTTRVSYCFDLKGPSVNIQTACSTSLVAIHSAVQSLLAGECDMAIAGGSTIELPHRQGYQYQAGEILSPDGHCRAFDHQSAGTVFGSGTGAVVLRRLDDAIAGGDRIYCVIRGSAINNDGSSKAGYLAPSVDQQAAVASESMAIAEVTADSIGFVAGHGTGTPIGDPIEVAALTQAFRETTSQKQSCVLGSVKPNIGHTDTAAGVASFIAASLALHHNEIPPSVDFDSPNPSIDFANSPFLVSNTARAWRQTGAPPRAMVHSLGVGGTNANVILEAAPDIPVSTTTTHSSPQIIALSAKSHDVLDAQSRRLAERLATHPGQSLADVSHTLLIGREAFNHRRVIVANDLDQAIRLLNTPDPQRVFTSSADAQLASATFLFPGGGSQYPQMGKGLFASEAVFREVIDQGCETLRPLIDCDLRELLFSSVGNDSEQSNQLERPGIQLPAIFLWEVAIAKLWISQGVVPTAMLGHSMGENTAAYLAGVMSFEDALQLVLLRGQLLERVPSGSMMTVDMSADRVSEYLHDEVDIAVVNGPDMCVVSGLDQAMSRFSDRMSDLNIDVKRIPIRIAAHSRLLDSILPTFRQFLGGIRLNPPAIPFLSNRTGTWITETEATSPDYWCEQLRHTVRFSDCLATLGHDPSRVFIEAGPGKILSALAKQHPSIGAKRAVFSSLRHPDQNIADVDYFYRALGQLWASGFPVDLAKRNAATAQRVTLPTYAFRKDRYWIEPTDNEPASANPSISPMQRRERMEEWFWEERWQEILTDDLEAINESTKWLLFLDDAGVGQEVADELALKGHQVTSVLCGDVFRKASPDRYVIVPELGAADYQRLIQSLAEDDRLPDRVLYMFPVTADESFRPGSTYLTRVLEQGVFGLTQFIAALAEQIDGEECHLTLVTNGAQSVSGERITYPEKTTALGPIQVAPREYPNLKTLAIDIGLGNDRACVDQNLTEQLVSISQASCYDASSLAIRDGRVFRSALVRSVLDSNSPDSKTSSKETSQRIRRGGTFLITGGLGGIGYEIAEMLAKEYQANLVLMARDTETPERKRRIESLRRHGGRVLAIQVDINDQLQMESSVGSATAELGAISGVFHAAGQIDDQLIATATTESMEEVLAAKVHGTRILQELFANQPLDFFALSSSTSTYLSPASQSAYVAANNYLNAFARSNPFPGSSTTVTAINWGVWKEIGMGARIHRQLLGQMDSIGYQTRLHSINDWELNDHRTPSGEAVLPGTAYLELVFKAAMDAFDTSAVEISDLAFVQPCVVEDHQEVELRVAIEQSGSDCAFEVQSRVGSEVDWQTNALGAFARLDQYKDQTKQGEVADEPTSDFVTTTRQAMLLKFGPRWNSYRWIHYEDDLATARLELPMTFEADMDDHPLHPALFDMATGFGLPLIDGYGQDSGLHVPVIYRSVKVYSPLPTVLRSTIRRSTLHPHSSDAIEFDIDITDDDGRVLVCIRGLQMQAVESQGFGHSVAPSERTIGKVSLSPAEKLFDESYRLGIHPEEGASAFELVMRGQVAPAMFVSPVDLVDLKSRFDSLDENRLEAGVKFARPTSAATFKAPSTPTEKWVASLWQDLLGIEQVGVDDSFFDLGGHSLLAVRFFGKLRQQKGIDLPLSTLISTPTIEQIAGLIQNECVSDDDGDHSSAAAQRYRFVVPLHDSKPTKRPPLFIVGGMFGNVLNLRYLAARLGENQPVYGLQAKGLIGDDAPHRRFPEMARDYLKEVRQIQPQGPYFLGGFSGGGVSAFEMAQQLTAAGQEIGILVLLDTPAVHQQKLTQLDKLKIHWDRVCRHRLGYLKTLRKDRAAWKETQAEELRALAQASGDRSENGAEFRSALIGQAFMEAHANYQTQIYCGDVHLFRPPLDVAHSLPARRRINADRQFMDEFNHWQPFVDGQVKLFEVAGDHDSMVLEPHVRTMATPLKRCLDEAIEKAVGPKNTAVNQANHKLLPEMV